MFIQALLRYGPYSMPRMLKRFHDCVRTYKRIYGKCLERVARLEEPPPGRLISLTCTHEINGSSIQTVDSTAPLKVLGDVNRLTALLK